MRIALAIFGMVFGLVLILAAAFNWRIIPWPTQRPTVGSGAPGMTPYVRVTAFLIGAVFIVLGALTLAGVI